MRRFSVDRGATEWKSKQVANEKSSFLGTTSKPARQAPNTHTFALPRTVALTPPPTHTYVRTLCFSAFCPAWWRAAIIQMTSETGGGTLVAYAYFFSGEWTGAAVDFQPLLARPCQCRCTVGCWLGEGRGGGRAHQCKKLTYKLTTACLDALCLFALGCGNWMSRQPV